MGEGGWGKRQLKNTLSLWNRLLFLHGYFRSLARLTIFLPMRDFARLILNNLFAKTAFFIFSTIALEFFCIFYRAS